MTLRARGEKLHNRIKVGDIMKSRIITIEKEAPVKFIADLMTKKGVGAVIVTNKRGVPIGIVTERDLVTRVIAKGRDYEETKAEDIMSKPLITVRPDTDIATALREMAKHNIRRLVVVQGSKLAGIITERDILQIAPDLMELLYEEAKLASQAFISESSSGYCDLCGEWSDTLTEIDGMLLCDDCMLEYKKSGEEL